MLIREIFSETIRDRIYFVCYAICKKLPAKTPPTFFRLTLLTSRQTSSLELLVAFDLMILAKSVLRSFFLFNTLCRNLLIII